MDDLDPAVESLLVVVGLVGGQQTGVDQLREDLASRITGG